MRRGLLGIVVLMGVTSVSLAWTNPDPPAAGKVIVVKMIDVSATEYKFEPALITAGPGDTLRFQQTTAMPHNVAFRDGPTLAKLGEATEGPYLMAAGQKYDLVIDGRFTGGQYAFVCTPHEMMGMKGTLTIKMSK